MNTEVDFLLLLEFSGFLHPNNFLSQKTKQLSNGSVKFNYENGNMNPLQNTNRWPFLKLYLATFGGVILVALIIRDCEAHIYIDSIPVHNRCTTVFAQMYIDSIPFL